MRVRSLLSLTVFLLLPLSALAGTGDFLADWTNVDTNTRGITRIQISGTPTADQATIRVFGKCHPADCDWGTTTLYLYGASVADSDYHYGTAVYDQAHAVTILTLVLQEDGRLGLDSYTHFKGNGRTDYHAHDHFGKGAAISLEEDCINFDYRRAVVSNIRGRWKIVVGPMWLKDFGTNEAEARQALQTIQQYHMTQQCFVGRPDPSVEYYLVDGSAPVGSFSGEDCVTFNPASIEVKSVQGSWKIVEGTHWILDFGTKEDEARTAFQIIQKYGFTHLCFVGRPDPSFTYFRR